MRGGQSFSQGVILVRHAFFFFFVRKRMVSLDFDPIRNDP